MIKVKKHALADRPDTRGSQRKRPVIAIGLDAAEASLIEQWMEQGYLPNLKQLRHQGSYGYLNSQVNYSGQETSFSCTEPLWAMFSTGCLPDKTGFWATVKYHQQAYDISCDKITGGYDYQAYSPFYALGENFRVATFDIPVSIRSDQVNGLQVLGWGGHFPFTPSHSSPPSLLPELIEQYGENPVLHNDHGPWWSKKYQQWLKDALEESIVKRVDICLDLIKREKWDLFVTVFGDIHSAGHDFYHLSQPAHPLYASRHRPDQPDPMLEIYQKVDWAIGQILAAVPEDAYVLCFSLHGMATNHQDTLSMMFLGEALYRFNFPGKVGFVTGNPDIAPLPMITSPLRNSWLGEMWRQVYDKNPLKQFVSTWLPAAFQRFGKGELDCPYTLGDNLNFMPALWYRSLWPQMKAFAIPSFSDGHIRINLKGRDPQGTVGLDEYDSLCDEITQLLYGLKNGRTGKPLVRSVIRTRQDLAEQDLAADSSKLIAADLVVVWEDAVTDVVDYGDMNGERGRIGPITLARPGGHRPQGFVISKGPGIEAGSNLATGHVVDLAPTILELIGAALPSYLEGQSLLNVFATSSSK